MKKLIAGLIVFVALLSPVFADAAVWVNGYTKSNGTYVQGHYRSNPDGIASNNWSYPGNTNPYTGKTAGGSVDSYLKNYYDSSSQRYSVSSAQDYDYFKNYYSTSYPSYSSYSTTYTEPKKKVKISTQVPWIVKQWVENNPDEKCSKSPLSSKDKKVCTKYQKHKDNDSYIWTTSSKLGSEYHTCDSKFYYFPDVCGVKKFTCEGTVAYCVAK